MTTVAAVIPIDTLTVKSTAKSTAKSTVTTASTRETDNSDSETVTLVAAVSAMSVARKDVDYRSI